MTVKGAASGSTATTATATTTAALAITGTASTGILLLLTLNSVSTGSGTGGTVAGTAAALVAGTGNVALGRRGGGRGSSLSGSGLWGGDVVVV